MKKKADGRNVEQYVLNCIPSVGTENDWTFEDAVNSSAVSIVPTIPSSKDLREDWWKINDQRDTGACVGFATAYGVLRWHYVQAGKMTKKQLPSARFIWMANKETDELTNYPTTFIETEGTQTKLALRVARNFGCVIEDDLPMDGGLSRLTAAQFYSKAATLRISSYYNIGRNLNAWRQWIASHGPILTRLGVDRTWDNATATNGKLDRYMPNTARGGHAVCIVGYTKDRFIVRNSWGESWGDKGFAYASDSYASQAFTEAYGAVL